jgi:hypothetical protein
MNTIDLVISRELDKRTRVHGLQGMVLVLRWDLPAPQSTHATR